MCKYLLILTVCLVIAGSGVVYGEPYSGTLNFQKHIEVGKPLPQMFFEKESSEEVSSMRLDSLNVRFVGSYDTPGYAWDVYVSGSYAYVADGWTGLRIINVSTPSNPTEVGSYDTPGRAREVYVSGSYAYVADSTAGLRIINVSIPSNPSEVGFYDTPGYAYGVYVSGSYAYVADEYHGLRIINVSTPSNPNEVGYCSTYSAYGVYVSGSYAYVADSDAGLRILDVSTPSNPYEAGYYCAPGRAYGVYVSGSYAYVADGTAGLQIYEFLGTSIEESKDIVYHSGLRLLQNPIRGDYIELELRLSQRDNIELGLYNLLGQRVKLFSLNGLSPGQHTLKLQAKGLSSGIYFLRLEGGRSNQSVKVTIVKGSSPNRVGEN